MQVASIPLYVAARRIVSTGGHAGSGASFTDAVDMQPAVSIPGVSGAVSDLTKPLLTMACKGVGVLAGASLVVLGLMRLSATGQPNGSEGGEVGELAGHAVDLGALAST